MIRSSLLVVLTCITYTLFSQTADTSKVLPFADVMPHFNGGDSAMYQFIKHNMTYPKTCLDSGIQGKVFVRFVVSATGQIKDAKIIKGVCDDLNAEALNTVSKLPPFIPGQQNGQNVDVYYTVPIVFKLTEKSLSVPRSSSFFQVLSTCDTWPEYPGGDKALEDFLNSNTDFEKNDMGEYVKGTASIGFIVDSLGKVTNIRVVEGKHIILNTEAKRVVSLFPRFKPARLHSKAINSYLLMPFYFSGEIPHPSEVIHRVPISPVFAGGDTAIYDILEQRVVAPKGYLTGEGTTMQMDFEVDTTGKVTLDDHQPKVNERYEQIARAIDSVFASNFQSAKPARSKDRAVNAYYNHIKLSFRILYDAERKLAFVKFDRRLPISSEASGIKIYTNLTKCPIYPRGDSALIQFSQKDTSYPADQRDKGLEARVLIRFVVSANGDVENVEVIRGVNPSFNEEAVKAVKALPKFTPGEVNGVRVPVYFILPVVFKLDNGR